MRPDSTGLPDLPTVFTPVVALREAGDALSRALALAPQHGAGTLVWVRSAARIEAAVVLEPELPLAAARAALLAGMNALADALGALGPPEIPIAFRWPATLLVNRGEVGQGRLAWPEGAAEEAVPDWLVVAVEARVSFPRGWEPGLGADTTALAEEGWDAEEISAADLTAAWARHLMANLAEWQRPGPHGGFKRLAEKFLARLEQDARTIRGKRGLDPATAALVVERDGGRHLYPLEAGR